MAHFAKLDENNIVTTVIVVHNNDAPTEEAGAQFLRDLFKEPDAVWKKTSYNTSGGVYYNPLPGDVDSPRTPAEDQSKSFRKNFASIGGYYDPGNDAFVAPKPFPSWSLKLACSFPRARFRAPFRWRASAKAKPRSDRSDC